MKLIVTGGAGYIGAHVVKQLLENNKSCQIHVIDNFSQSRKNIITNDSITYHEVDICNSEQLKKIFQEINPEFVLHFAALASVPDSVKNPAEYFNTNVIGSFNILEAMRLTSCKKIIFSSSASVYGEPISEVITEEHPKNPTNPYGYTKLVVEKMLEAYYKAYGISSISFRYFCAAGNESSYKLGEYHNPETHVIPALVETALGHRDEFNVFGDDFDTADGTGVRDYIHVDDLASAHINALSIINKETICESYNLGINKGFSVRELIATVEEISGSSIPVNIKGRRDGDPSRLIADASKAMKRLNWSPKHTDIRSIALSAYEAFKKHS
jgi:UDP-glucose 4-epimerase